MLDEAKRVTREMGIMGGWTKAAMLGLGLGALGLLGGCETMSAEECALADWRALGFDDAAQSGAYRFNERAQSCAEKGYSADIGAYQTGFANGMVAFCQPARAFAFASDGGTFSGVCPAELEPDFRAAFMDGERVHDAEGALEEARSEVSRLESRREDIDDNIGSRERSLAEAKTDEERRDHRAEIDRLRRERRDVNDDIRTAQARVPYLQRLYDEVRFEMGARWGY